MQDLSVFASKPRRAIPRDQEAAGDGQEGWLRAGHPYPYLRIERKGTGDASSTDLRHHLTLV